MSLDATSGSREKLLYLESLRGMAALIVVMYHGGMALAFQSPLVDNTFSRNGYLMVDFFFVLSGFVIAYSSHDRIGSWGQAVAFQVRRAARMFPLHLTTLCAVLGLELMLLLLGSAPQLAPLEVNDSRAFLSNLVLLQAFTEGQSTFNRPAWSISVEFYTYAVFAVVTLLAAWIRQAVRDGLAIAIVFGCGVYLAQLEPPYIARGDVFIRCLFSFFLGVLVFRLSGLIRIGTAVAPICLAGGIVLLALRDDGQVPDLAFPPLFSLCILGLVASGPSSLKQILNHPSLVRLGTLSFGIYLWHWPVLWILPLAVGALIGVPPYLDPETRNTFIPINAAGQSALLALGVALTFMLASASHRWIEVPCNEWGRRTTSGAARGRPRALAAAR